jgi:hypothetical protein
MPSNKLKAFITYLDEEDHARLKKFAKSQDITMAKVIREGVLIRLSGDSPYIAGFNDGLQKAEDVMRNNAASEMKFPSGLSFGELIANELFKHYMRVQK